MQEELTINSDATLGKATRLINDLYSIKKFLTVTVSTGRTRTSQQNKAIHKFCRMIAESCNDAGYEYTIKSLLANKAIMLPWTWERVKDVIWLEVQSAMYPDKKRSTTALKSDEVTQVADVIIRHLAEELSINLPFPSKDEREGYKA